ncbi:mCG125396 [Mus musculus]|uniref:Uncharacterized protein n=1 Tax=Mus musculus TaxID=10090 RepID=Q8C648_MOUSE|nr:mCG125396 [Mus musculus]BAC36400.1 unnamed protein product [Mus musculus]
MSLRKKTTAHHQGQNSLEERNLKSLFEFSLVLQQAAAGKLNWAIMVVTNGSAWPSLLDARKGTGPYFTLSQALPANLYMAPSLKFCIIDQDALKAASRRAIPPCILKPESVSDFSNCCN